MQCGICVFNVRSHMHNPFSKPFKNLSVKMLTDGLASRYKLFMNNTLAIKQTDQHAFDLWLAYSCFFRSWRGWSMPWLALAVGSGSYSKTNSSPVTTHSKKWGSFSIDTRKSWHVWLLMCFWSWERFLGTIFAQMFLMHNSSVKIWWITLILKLNLSPINLTLNWWSDLTRSRTLFTFSTFLDVVGLQLHGLLSLWIQNPVGAR